MHGIGDKQQNWSISYISCCFHSHILVHFIFYLFTIISDKKNLALSKNISPVSIDAEIWKPNLSLKIDEQVHH